MNTDLNQMYQLLMNGGVSQEMATYIVMYRQKSGGSLGGTINFILGGNKTSSKTVTVQGALGSYTLDFTKKAGTPINTIYDLIGTSVTRLIEVRSRSGSNASLG